MPALSVTPPTRQVLEPHPELVERENAIQTADGQMRCIEEQKAADTVCRTCQC